MRSRRTLLYLPLTAVVIGWMSPDAAAFDLRHSLSNPNPGLADQFGEAVSASGSHLLVGASRDDTPGQSDDAGVASLYDLGSGERRLTVTNPGESPAYDAFGAAVSTDGTRLVVGAPFDDRSGVEQGAAYVFDMSGNLLHALNSPNLFDGGQFGMAVGVDERSVVVGEPGACATASGTCAGAVYLFRSDTGDLDLVIENPSPDPFDRFGASVAIHATSVLVGAPGEEGGGAAYLFSRASGDLVQTFRSTSPSEYGLFGAAVALSGNTVVVGAPFGNSSAADDGAGVAFVFDADSGLPRITLANPTPAMSEQFGRAVSVDGGVVVVGAPFDSTPGTTDLAGATHVFDEATGEHLAVLTNPSPGFRDAFGQAVTVAPSGIAVGALRDNSGAPKSGSVFIYKGPSRNLPPDVTGAVADIQQIWPPNGRTVRIRILGVTDPDNDPIALSVTGITQDEPVGASPDARGVGTSTAILKAERDGKGNGRVYRISFLATDMSGSSSPGSVLVGVPHDRRGWGVARNDGQRFDATASARSKPATEPLAELALGNSPNPFNPSTVIAYSLGEPGPVSLSVYNTLGQVVRQLTSAELGSGSHTARWDGRDDHGRPVSSGTYIARLVTSDRVATHRMLMLK